MLRAGESGLTEYACFVESGPRHRKSLVHVPELLGCVATGPTTDAALAATLDAIRTFRRFLADRGEPVPGIAGDPDGEPVQIRVAEHVTEGEWLGNGSPTLVIEPDLLPLSDAELGLLIRRFHVITEALAEWAEVQTSESLDTPPEGRGRTARAVLLHVLAPVGGYLSAALGGASGFSANAAAAERGEISIAAAVRRCAALADERIAATTPDERSALRLRTTGAGPQQCTLRKALRRMLEHGWEHLAELSRRPGGPALEGPAPSHWRRLAPVADG